jgi:hypothetical protein
MKNFSDLDCFTAVSTPILTLKDQSQYQNTINVLVENNYIPLSMKMIPLQLMKSIW